MKKREGEGDVVRARPVCARNADGFGAIDIHGGDLPWLKSPCRERKSEASKSMSEKKGGAQAGDEKHDAVDNLECRALREGCDDESGSFEIG